MLKGDQNATKDYTYTYNTATGKAAEVKLPTADSNNGNKLTVTFDPATASGEAQNEVAKLIRDQGFSVTSSSEKNATDNSKFDNSITLKLNGTEKYKVVEQTAGSVYEIRDNTGKKIASINLTVNNGGTVGVGQTDKFTKIGTETITASSATAGYGNGETMKYYDKDGNGIPENALDSYFTSSTNAAGTTITTSARSDAKNVYDALGNKLTPDSTLVTAKQDLTGALSLTLHVGADATSNNQISVNLDAMSAKGLGVNGLKVDGADDTNARDAIETIKEAIQKVSTQRSALGAVQNRLEHTINNLDNVVENTTSAESQIRDTDMATEMVKYSNNNILAQAGQAMLAQANQSNQGVLSLLQ